MHAETTASIAFNEFVDWNGGLFFAHSLRGKVAGRDGTLAFRTVGVGILFGIEVPSSAALPRTESPFKQADHRAGLGSVRD